MDKKHKILVVDDELICLDQICHYLEQSDYHIVKVNNGHDALTALSENPTSWDLVLLDKFIDDLDGMAILAHIKSDPILKVLPVILQTCDTSPDKILEGIRAGAYYYLTKPFSKDQLQAVVANALNQHTFIRLTQEELSDLKECLLAVDEIAMNFQSREQARQTVVFLTHVAGLSAVHQMGLTELMLNAIEHGNLGISYDEKTDLIKENRLESEIRARLELPEYADKQAAIHFKRSAHELHFTITDQGLGFDWEPFLEMQIERIHDNHGRGIAMAKNLAFSELTYLGTGNCVTATITLKDACIAKIHGPL